MQAPTHILAGVILSKLFTWRYYRPVGFVLMAVLGFFSHGVLDKIAKATYHRPDADFTSPVWVGYHIAVVLVTVLFFYLWWRSYKWGILFAILPDLDWVFIHGQSIFNLYIPFYRTPHMHNFLHWCMDHTLPFSYLNQLPDNRYNPWAALWEVLLLAAMLLLVRELSNRRRNIHF